MNYRILFKDKPGPSKELLTSIKEKHQGDIEGITELYDALIEEGVCESPTSYLIYYVAYTLGLEDIELILVRVN